jgi:hexosaminidase
LNAIHNKGVELNIIPTPGSMVVAEQEQQELKQQPSSPLPAVTVWDQTSEHLLDGCWNAALAFLEEAFGLELKRAQDAASFEVVIKDGVGGNAKRTTGTDPRPVDRRGCDEGYQIIGDARSLTVRAVSSEGVFRSITTIASFLRSGASLAGLVIQDQPRYAWRGLSLDVARHRFTVAEILRVIDLMATLKMNVLHLHLSDVQAWRVPVPGYPSLAAGQEGYARTELERLVSYARERYITVVPELDMPGHIATAVRAIPELVHTDYLVPAAAYLSWDNPAVPLFYYAVLDQLTKIFDSAFIHIGGDEAYTMPADEYARFIRQAATAVKSRGRAPLAWQEAARAAVWGPGDLIQLWVADRDRLDPERARRQWPEKWRPFIDVAARFAALSAHDAVRAASQDVPVLISSSDPLYLDRRPSETSTEPGQEADLGRLGMPAYEPLPSTSILRWNPSAQLAAGSGGVKAAGITVAGVEAAIWSETIDSFDDLAMLLLPRLAFVAERAWSLAPLNESAVLRATRAAVPVWERLGFSNLYRSTLVFGQTASSQGVVRHSRRRPN